MAEGEYQFWEQFNKPLSEIQKDAKSEQANQEADTRHADGPANLEANVPGERQERLSELQSIQKNLNAQGIQDLPEVKEDIIQDQQFMEKREVKYIRKDLKGDKKETDDLLGIPKQKHVLYHQS